MRMTEFLGRVRPLDGDGGTTMNGADGWRSAPIREARRGLSLSLLYVGKSQDRMPWPYNAEAEDAARTIVTVWTSAGSFSFLASDLEKGPILAPEYGFFVHGCITPLATPPNGQSTATSAREFVKELAAKGMQTIRRRTGEHPEQTWDGAVGAMFPGKSLPAIPRPEFLAPMRVEVPCPRLAAQWDLGVAPGPSRGEKRAGPVAFQRSSLRHLWPPRRTWCFAPWT